MASNVAGPSSGGPFWRPGADRLDSESEGVYLHCNPNAHLPLILQRQRLPIYAHKNEILYGLEKHQALVLVGETGTGKSTQLPLYLFEAGWAEGRRCIACTQPRRIAAISLAQRVADEFGCVLGEEVGYSIRFDSKISKATKIKFCTDGFDYEVEKSRCWPCGKGQSRPTRPLNLDQGMSRKAYV